MFPPLVAAVLAFSWLAVGPAPRALAAPVSTAPAAATCVSSVGPGIPHPANLPVGVNGFHAQWYGQSGYPTLCPGDRSTATVAYHNSGSLGWVRGRMGEVAYLGTWGPEPGQDRVTPLGGDGGAGSPTTGWPRYNRIAMQPADYVGPGQVAWFQFTIQAPATAGYYRLYLRPPDYAQCAGKVNSYDYAVYNSNLRRWINYNAVNAQNGGLFFNGASTSVYRRTYVYYQNQTPITAAITNFPLLVQNGSVIDSTSEQNGSQLLKGTKGAIGVDGTYIYLAIVTNATVTDSAYVMQALGARDALNLDGGGTAAMWISGSYKVGPGRLLPNAIVLTKP